MNSPAQNALPETAPNALPEDVLEPQAEIPAMAAVIEPAQETSIKREPFLASLPAFIFSGASAWADANVQ